MPRITKEQGLGALLAALVSILTGLTTLWTFTEKVFAGEIKEQLAPVVQVQKILLESDIVSRRNSIAAMEFKRDTCNPRPDCWAVRDAQDLRNAESELIARETALKGLQ